MQMTNEEIVRDYNAAANKQKQIKVLAELNCTSPGEIRRVLAEAGVPGVEAPKRPKKIKPEVPQDSTAEKIPKAPKAASARKEPSFWERMEAILAALPEKLPPEAEGIVQNLLQTLFADYLEQRLGGKRR